MTPEDFYSETKGGEPFDTLWTKDEMIEFAKYYHDHLTNKEVEDLKHELHLVDSACWMSRQHQKTIHYSYIHEYMKRLKDKQNASN